MTNLTHFSIKQITRFIAAIILAFASLYGGINLSKLGMDWGYYAIEHYIGQPSDDAQWVGAAYLIVLIAPAVYGAMIISVLKGTLGGNWYRRLLLLPMMFINNYVSSSSSSPWSDCLSSLPYVGGAWLVAIFLSVGFDRLYTSLTKTIDVSRLLISLQIVLLLTALLPISFEGLANSHHLHLEFVLYCALLCTLGFFAAFSVRSAKLSALFLAQFFASLPVLIFNLANLTFAVFCNVAGKTIDLHLGWQALGSALLILMAASISAMLGAAFYYIIARLRTNTY